MHLTRFTDYGLRTLVYLSVQQKGQLISIDEVCETFEVSRNHMMKIVHKLGQEGFIHTKRGLGGGMRLALSPAQINLGDVVRSLEPNMMPVNCHEPNVCVLLPGCELKTILADAVDAFLDVLDHYTLEDLANPKQLVRLLLEPETLNAKR